MKHARTIRLLWACLVLGACSQAENDAAIPTEEDAPPPITAQASADPMQEDSFGPVQYSYDTASLTRAEIILPLPPDFSETVFAVKFIPTDLVDDLGQPGCSYEDKSTAADCTAEREIGFALAFLERPIDTYGEALFESLEEDMGMAPANIGGQEGFSLDMRDDGTAMRYTYVPVEERTLLLVERMADDVKTGEQALADVRESLRFPED